MAVHGLIRLADGLRLPLEFDPQSRRRPVIEISTPPESAVPTLAAIAAFFAVEQAPAVFKAMSTRPTYLKATWDFVRRTFEPDLLAAGQKALVAVAVSAAAGSEYGIDFFTREARRLGASEEMLLETYLVVQRFAGLTKFATSLNLEPDRVPQF